MKERKSLGSQHHEISEFKPIYYLSPVFFFVKAKIMNNRIVESKPVVAYDIVQIIAWVVRMVVTERVSCNIAEKTHSVRGFFCYKTSSRLIKTASFYKIPKLVVEH